MPRSESARPGKRPLRTLNAKICAIRRVHDGESKAEVARDIGVPESTLRGWCKSDTIISQMKNMETYEQAPASEHESGNSDTNSHRGSLPNPNLSTNVNNNPSTSTARNPTADELEAGPSIKRMRMENARSSTSRRQSSSLAMERFPAIAGSSRSSTPLNSMGLVNGTHAEPSISRTGTRQDSKTLETNPLFLSMQQYMQEQVDQHWHCLNHQLHQQQAAGQPLSAETIQILKNLINIQQRLLTMYSSQGQLPPRQVLEYCISNPIPGNIRSNTSSSSSNNGGGANSSNNTSNNSGNGSNENNDNNAQEASNNKEETVKIRARIEKACYYADKLTDLMENFGSQCFGFQDVQNVRKVKKFLHAWDIRLIAGNGKRPRSSS